MRWKGLIRLAAAVGLVAAACSGSGRATTTTAPGPGPTEATGATTATPETSASLGTEAPATSAGPADSEPLVVWADETRLSTLQAAAAAFEASTGTPVEVELVGFGNIRADIVRTAPEGGGADVFVGAHDWLGELVAEGVVAPLALGDVADDLFPVAIEAFSFGGEAYGLPHAMEAIGLYRNTELVPDAPATFADLLAECERLAATLTQCLATPAGADFYHHYPFFAAAGGYVFGYDPATGYDVTDIGIAGDSAVAGFAFFDQLVADGVLDSAVEYGTMADLFYNGESAFMWTGPWELPNAQAAGVAYAVSKLPAIEGNVATPFVMVQGFFVNALSDRRELAETFVLDFLSTEDVMLDLYSAGLQAPAHVDALELVSGDPDVAGFGASAADGHPTPNIVEMSEVWVPMGTAVQAIYDQSGDPATVLETARQAVVAAIAG